jgi:hypothetical protein
MSDDAETVRASDSERDVVVAQLNEAAGEGRITLDEFSERAERVYAARTRGELATVLADLPKAATDGLVARPTGTPARSAARGQWHITPIGGLRQRGRWRLPSRLTSISVLGGMDLDLTEAEMSSSEAVVTHVSVIGGVDVTVPPGVNVEVVNICVLGSRSVGTDALAGPNAPTLRIRAFGVIGGVRVKTGRARG